MMLCMCRATARDRVALDKLSKQLQQQLHRYKQIVSDHDKRRANYPLQTTGMCNYSIIINNTVLA